MSNFAIDININAPALVGALEHLCTALGKPVMPEAKPVGTAAKPEPVPQPVQTAPVTPAPVQTAAPQAPAPTAAPAAAPTVKTYTTDEIAKAAGDFMTPETIPQLQALLASFGVSGL
ncbi:MAG: hypothetical protein ACLR6L_12075, partial [Agathobaculum sp.]